jgi:hypothetical protein
VFQSNICLVLLQTLCVWSTMIVVTLNILLSEWNISDLVSNILCLNWKHFGFSWIQNYWVGLKHFEATTFPILLLQNIFVLYHFSIQKFGSIWIKFVLEQNQNLLTVLVRNLVGLRPRMVCQTNVLNNVLRKKKNPSITRESYPAAAALGYGQMGHCPTKYLKKT